MSATRPSTAPAFAPGLSAGNGAELADVSARAVDCAGDPVAALGLARELGDSLPTPGRGATAHLWEVLARIGAADLTIARAVEPHLDALAILAQAADEGLPVPDTSGSWGVFAAEGPGTRLEATMAGSAWTLGGVKPWCSLGTELDRALVTAWVSPTQRGLFAVSLKDSRVEASGPPWVARGLRAVESRALSFSELPAVPVGDPQWYLARPGFAWGGMGVAAVWFGGALGVAERILAAAGGREPDQVAQVHLGACDAVLYAARVALRDAAAAVDAGAATGAAASRLALRVRSVVAASAEEVLRRSDHALGPAPLVTEDDHASRVADLHLYVRQWHAERDLAALGRGVLESQESRPQ